MAAEVLPSARWLYCGEPDESQRAVLGNRSRVPRSSLPFVPFVCLYSPPAPVGLLSQLGQDPLQSPPLLGAWPGCLCHHPTILLSPPPSWMRTSQAPFPPGLYRSSMTSPTHACPASLHRVEIPRLSRSGLGLSSIPLVISFCCSPPQHCPHFPISSSQLDQDLLQSPFRSGPGLPYHSHSFNHSLPTNSPVLPYHTLWVLLLSSHSWAAILQSSSPMGSCRIQATCVLLCTRAMTPQTPGRRVSGS